ncbi:MAG: hypothetical protein NZ610_02335 [Candidatus Bipolaricaulota bacterium]|nr:hypothetical protein [Candidatus Bipolaricaulota bacterium]MCS7274231.1 hypothetical protein [Candidatus Bipolaricaulota bacterium]MDW8030516.1 hypothetical protein [Candidatus Bipolaricaulota bacterium]
MITAHDVERLRSWRAHDHPIVSLYLNVTPPHPFVSELNSLIHSQKEQWAKNNNLHKTQLRALEELLAQIEHHVRAIERQLGRTRLLAIFASADGFWQEYRLPVALPSQLVIELDPYIRPLTILLDEFDRYCVLVADARKARIFSLYLGEFEEHLGVFNDEVHSKVSVGRGERVGGPGVWGSTGELRIQRHIEDHFHRHLKRVAEYTFDLFRQEQCELLIIAGPEDKTLPYLKDHLHSYLRERLAGEFHARPDMPISELKERALAVAQSWERRYEEQLIARLLETAHRPNGLAVVGVEPTLEALMLGQVHTLVLHHSARIKGTVCPTDHFLSSYLERCPICHEAMHYTEDLADEMVEEAIHQNAEIEHIFTNHDSFTPYNVGAILRFR